MKKQELISLIGGLFFGFGLAYGGMAKQEIVLNFLQLNDYGLILLMGSSAFMTFFAIQVIPKFMEKPVMGGVFKPRQRNLTMNTILGAMIFGIGWGISGQCSGSYLASLGIGNLPVILGIITMFLGSYVMGKFFG